jgi:hypothetical protein
MCRASSTVQDAMCLGYAYPDHPDCLEFAFFIYVASVEHHLPWLRRCAVSQRPAEAPFILHAEAQVIP